MKTPNFVLIAVWIVITPLAVLSQTFEAASVKPSQPGAVGSTFEFLSGGGLRIANGSLRQILETAYDIRDFQILGGPGWLNSDRYDILAKGGAAEAKDEKTATRLKLRTLLAERFHLKAHNETAEVPVYTLLIAKNGSKLSAGAEGGVSTPAGIQSGCGQMTGTHTTMANLTVYLTRQLHRPVVDQTGLGGKYDFQIQWTPDEGPCPGATGDAPSLFTALQENLGLRLESGKGPQDVLVIDSAQRPEAN
jgi:uncharacterized protein (TIGR03435 family)